MKKLFTILATLLFTASLFAQTYNGPNGIPADSSAAAISISTATQAAGTATVTLTSALPDGFTLNKWINIAGVTDGTPAGCFNGNYQITVLSASAFTYTTTCTADSAGSLGSAAPIGDAAAVTNSNLLITVNPGPVQCLSNNDAHISFITKTQFNLLANSTYYLIYRCSTGKLFASTVAPSPADLLLNTIVTNASTVATNGDSRQPINFPPTLDGVFAVPPGACSWATSGTAGATNNTIVADGASFTPVLQGSSTAAGASNNTLTCLINVPSQLTSLHGVTVNDVVVAYGVQTTALTSLGAPTFGTITFPAPGTSETPSTVTPVAAGGTLVVNPVVGSANLGTTTAGAYFTERCRLATPVALTTDLRSLYFKQVFAQSAAAAQLVSTPGLLVHFSRIIQ